MSTTADIWVICGSSCAGKSTTAQVLANRFDRAAHVEGDDMQRLIVSGCRWAVPAEIDFSTGVLRGEPGSHYELRIRNACLVAASFADAGIAAIVTDTVTGDGFEAMVEVFRGRTIHFVVLRPPVKVLRQRGVARLPEEAAFLAERYGGDTDHPEAAEYAERLRAASEGRPTNEFEEAIERGLDGLPEVGLRIDPSGLDPEQVVDLLLARRAESSWTVSP